MRKEIVCKKCITCMFRTIVSRCEVAAKRRTHKTWILPRQRERWKVDVEVVIWTWHRQRRTGTALYIHAHTRARLLVHSFGSVRFRDSIPQYSDCCLIFSCLATFCLYHRRVFLSKFHPFSCISPTSAEARSNFSATCILFRSVFGDAYSRSSKTEWNETQNQDRTSKKHTLTHTDTCDRCIQINGVDRGKKISFQCDIFNVHFKRLPTTHSFTTHTHTHKMISYSSVFIKRM